MPTDRYKNLGVPPPHQRLPRHARVVAQLERSFEAFLPPSDRRATSELGHSRHFDGAPLTSALPRIALQNSKVAAVKIFGENLKRKEVEVIRTASVALPKSPMNLAQGDEVPRIITRRTRQRPSEFLTLPANDFCNTIPPLADILRVSRHVPKVPEADLLTLSGVKGIVSYGTLA